MLKILDMKNGLVTRVSIFNAPVRLKEPMKFEDISKVYEPLHNILLEEDIEQHFLFCKPKVISKSKVSKEVPSKSGIDEKGEVVTVYQSNRIYSAPLKNLKLEFMNSKVLSFNDIYGIISKYLDNTYSSIVYKYISYLESIAFIYRADKGVYQYNENNEVVSKGKIDIGELRKMAIEEAKSRQDG